MFVSILLLLLGFVLLVKGGDWLVEGSRDLARSWGVSDLVIGLTIVAFGTSSPEFVVSLLASIRSSTELSVGNVVGSNIANIWLILGLSALVCPMFAQRGTVWKEMPFLLLTAVVLLVQANDQLIDGAATSALTRTDGMIFLVLFAIFLYYIFTLVGENWRADPRTPVEAPPLAKTIVWVVIGLVLLVLGGHLAVGAATSLARTWGMSERLIGLTIVALGTSLPELATSVIAAYRKNADIAIGNIVGSNIFNTLWILGFSACYAPLPFPPAGNIDLMVMLAATIMLFLAMFIGNRKHQIERYEGATFVLCYAVYMGWLVTQG